MWRQRPPHQAGPARGEKSHVGVGFLARRPFKTRRSTQMNAIKTFLLLTGLTALFLFVGGAMGGRAGMEYAFIFACVMNLGSYWFSDKIVLAMYRAKPVTALEAPELVRTVQTLAHKANIPMPKVYIIPSDIPNAFATGRSPSHAAVAATQGILDRLNEREL